MTKELACYLILMAVLWWRDQLVRPLASRALWVPLLWIMILGTRPVSAWIQPEQDVENLSAAYLEGSPLDRNIFLALIISGFIILWRRRVDWGEFCRENRWLLIFFAYCGISAMWSDYPFVSFKRWIKDLGNVVMVLVILSEGEPYEALKAIFSRFICIAVPLSVVFIKYYPAIGRYYNRWTYEPTYCGVTTNKNELGIILVVSGLFLVDALLHYREGDRDRWDLYTRLLLLAMTLWLLHMAASSTAKVCLCLGALLLWILRFPAARRQVRNLWMYAAAVLALGTVVYTMPEAVQALVAMVGRDVTLTGRTDIWKDVLSQQTDPLLGTGYRSFWIGPVLERLRLNQAHNGYIETYLNTGYVGLVLLLTMILSVGKRFQDRLFYEGDLGALRFCFFVVGVFYNWTEAMYNALSLIWFTFLLAATSCYASEIVEAREAETAP